MRVDNSFTRSRLSMEHCREIIAVAGRRGVVALSLTGGEPLLFAREVAALIELAGKAGIEYTRTGTNGFFLRNPEDPDFCDRVKRMVGLLVATPLRNFWISIDSADPQTHERLRGFPGMIRGLEKALPIFHEHGLYPTANLGLNRYLGGSEKTMLTTGKVPATTWEKEHYLNDVETGVNKFFSLVKNLGFTLVNFCYPMSIDETCDDLAPVYPASSTEHIVRFSREEKHLLFAAMLKTIPSHRETIRIFTPLSALYTLVQSTGEGPWQPFPCRGGIDHFFISATSGHTYPCGYRGHEDLGDYRQLEPVADPKRVCTRCDWECFRDPAELMGPLLVGLSNPLQLVTRYRRDSTFFRLWLDDLRYYRQCDLFHGRRLPSPAPNRPGLAPAYAAKVESPAKTG